MATLSHWLFFGWIALGLLSFVLLKAADRPGDDFGAVFPGLALGALAIAVFIAWLILLVIRG